MSGLPPPDAAAVAAFWSDFVAATEAEGEPYEVFQFGDSPALADELLALVLHGPKRATAGFLAEFEDEGRRPPRAGDLSIACDGRGAPRCVIRSTQVAVAPLGTVDAAFAWEEGEGDRSLAYWREAHEAFFRRQVGDDAFSWDLPTVFERFQVMWVPGMAVGAPPVRPEPPTQGPELPQLCGFLDYQRASVLAKIHGLDREQLARAHPPSTLTLAGLLNHLALVEDWWFRVRFAGLPEAQPWAGVGWDADPDWEFRTAREMEPEALRERYREACERSRAVVREAGDLDRLSARAWPDGRHWDLRWVLLHMIEETARHAGHADLLREAIDGEVGD